MFLDIHYLGAGVPAKAVADAHQKDLAVEQKYGVNFSNYWLDEKDGIVMCLAEAKDSTSLIENPQGGTWIGAGSRNESYRGKIKQGASALLLIRCSFFISKRNKKQRSEWIVAFIFIQRYKKPVTNTQPK